MRFVNITLKSVFCLSILLDKVIDRVTFYFSLIQFFPLWILLLMSKTLPSLRSQRFSIIFFQKFYSFTYSCTFKFVNYFGLIFVLGVRLRWMIFGGFYPWSLAISMHVSPYSPCLLLYFPRHYIKTTSNFTSFTLSLSLSPYWHFIPDFLLPYWFKECNYDGRYPLLLTCHANNLIIGCNKNVNMFVFPNIL